MRAPLLMVLLSVSGCARSDWVILEGRATTCSPERDWQTCPEGLCRSGRCVPPEQSCTFVVDMATGSDGSPGSFAAPFSTIQRAADAIKALGQGAVGSSACVAAGSYPERVTVSASGAEARPVVFASLGKVTLQGFDLRADFVAVHGFEMPFAQTLANREQAVLIAGRGVAVVGSTITGSWSVGVDCERPGCDRALLSANTIRGSSYAGMRVPGASVRVSANTIEATQDGLVIFGDGSTYDHNQVTNTEVCFITFDTAPWPALTNARIESNHCLGATRTCLDLAAFTSPSASSDVKFRNNVCECPGTPAMVQGIARVWLVNNLFLARARSTGLSLDLGADQSVIANNIFYGNFDPAYVTKAQQLVLDYNLAFDPDHGATNPLTEPHGRVGVDPLLDLTSTDVARRYRPAAASPAVDVGNNSFASDLDLAGQARVQDGNGDGVPVVDMGPLELSGR